MNNGTITMTGAEYDALAGKIAALEAELARLRAGQEPVAYITGYHGGRCIIEPVNRAAVLPSGMALYATPQPGAVPAGWKLVPVEPTPEMVSAAEEAHMPFGDMDIALRMAILSAPSAPATAVSGETVQGVNQQLLEALEQILNAEMNSPISMNNAGCVKKMQGIARAAIAAARQEGGK